jgi:hypothetical protein
MNKTHHIKSRNGIALLFVLAVISFSCGKNCQVCRLEQINGPNSPSFPNDTIYIDTLETCDRLWIKENNVPAGKYYYQSWRCEVIQ